jgi:hypothetical protein
MLKKMDYFEKPQSSVLNGEAGIPSLLKRLTAGKSAQP